MESRWLRAGLRVWVALVLAFLFIPIVLIVLYAFNSSNIESWPISGFTLHWFSVAWHDSQVRSAFLLSVKVGLFATALALVVVVARANTGEWASVEHAIGLGNGVVWPQSR